jgi:hypothetical protein
VDEPVTVQRRIRRRIDRSGVSADVAADLNIAVAAGVVASVDVQQIRQRRGRSAASGRDPQTKETP